MNMKKDIKLIALDMDGTLLTFDKRLSERNRIALQRASDRGIHIVPATGRLFSGLPQVVLGLPWLKYAINSNGASVYDVDGDSVLYHAEIPLSQAVRMMSWLDGLPVIYDCYMDDRGWMTRTMYDQIATYAYDPIVVDYMRSIRTPVDDLKSFVSARCMDVQKIQAFCLDVRTQRHLLFHTPFPNLTVSSSVERNVEFNHKDANKGAALLALAAHLHIPRAQIMAFGDGANDIPMLRDAGIGVAMGNAPEEVKAAADVIAAGNDEDGVAGIIESLVLSDG